MPALIVRNRLISLHLESLETRETPAAGDMDLSFGGGGNISTAIGLNDDVAKAIAVQADGKVILAGTTFNGSNQDFALSRQNVDGTLDLTFSFDGKLSAFIGSSDDTAASMAIQPDGKILVAGYTSNGASTDFALVRLLADGSLDTSFGVTGKIVTPMGLGDDLAQSVAVQSDGKIVVAGSAFDGTNVSAAIARFNSNGTLDTTFSGDGKQILHAGTGENAVASMAIQADGKIVLVGSAVVGSTTQTALWRFKKDGTRDTTFSGDGIANFAVGSADSLANGVTIQADGKIIVAGQSTQAGSLDFTLLRLNKTGTLDINFSGDGIQTTSFGVEDDTAKAVTLQPDGKIVATGGSSQGHNNVVALARYNVDGSLDLSFDGDGKTLLYPGSSNAVSNAIAIQADGKIDVAGASFNGSNNDFLFSRFFPNGSPDHLTNGDGRVLTHVGEADQFARALAVQPDGKIIAVGNLGSDPNATFAVLRYNENGTLDSSFGIGGKVISSIGSGSNAPNSVALQNDGKIVVAGHSFNGVNYDFAIVRYNTDGTLDNTFGTNGIVATDFLGFDDQAVGLVIQNDGKIVAAGFASNGVDHDFALVRYLTDGTKDPTFGTNGIVTNPVGGSTDDIRGLALAPDGKIVVAGAYNNGWVAAVVVARYTTAGQLDLSFYGSGFSVCIVGATNSAANGVIVQPDGKIVVTGEAYNGFNTDIFVARFNTNGPLDPTFNGGSPRSDYGSFEEGYAVGLQPDGKVLVGAEAYNGANDDFIVLRYNSDGTLDSTFGLDGHRTIAFPAGGPEAPRALAIQPNGRTIVAGIAFNESSYDFGLARVLGDNHAPVAIPTTMLLKEDGKLTVTKPEYFSEPDGDSFTAELLYVPTHGKIAYSPYGTFTYTPDPNFAGTDRFAYKVTDSFGLTTIGSVQFVVNSLAALLPDPDLPGKFSLYVTGTEADETLSITPVGTSKSSYRVQRGTGAIKTITGVTGQIYVDAGEGNDVVSASTVKIPMQIDGGSGNDTLTGGAAADELIGGPGNDVLVGGAGNDSLTGDLGNDSLDGGLGIDRIVENGDVNFTLMQGTKTTSGSLAGLGSDVLVKNSIEEAEISGGDGNNRIDASAFIGSVWLFGLVGNDTLIAGNGPSILVGGDGNDSLVGGNGSDLLIGGEGADSINGGGNDDLCIAGATIHDQDSFALGRIEAEWTRPSTSYDVRINRLRGLLSGGLNGTYTLASSNISNDGLIDTMTGGLGTDWFLSSVSDSNLDVGIGVAELVTLI